MNINNLKVETEDGFATLLELAANDDLEAFKRQIDREPSSVNDAGLWYTRQKGSNQMVLQHMTPLMVAATYGSVEVLKHIISLPEADVNRTSNPCNTTALHCAASGGSHNTADVVRLLLEAGADPKAADANGRRPFDVIALPPKLNTSKCSLQMMLAPKPDISFQKDQNQSLEMGNSNPDESTPPGLEKGEYPVDTSSPDMKNGTYSAEKLNPSKCTLEMMLKTDPSFEEDQNPSLDMGNSNPDGYSTPSGTEKREYPIDPSLPDIKNSIYSTDEFRMFSFKVRPCSRAYSHDWTECPFVHPGENARRRDPRKYHYSCVPCPDFRKGACRRGDMCEYAHGVFECWLHPAQYRTRLCKDGAGCNRRVCFFAHAQDELRPLYVSTGSAVPSPRAANDFAAQMAILPPGSPSSPFTPPMSPSANGGMPGGGWASQQNNVPTLHLPGSNLQSSRLRSSLHARDIPPEDLSLYADIEALNELSLMSQQQQNLFNRSVRPKTVNPSNLEDIFSSEGVFSPTHKSAVLNQFQQQQQSMLSPIKTTFSPRNMDHSLMQAQGPYGIPSPGRISPRNVDPISPMSSRMAMLARQDKQNHHQFRSLSSRDLGSNAAAAVASLEESRSKWGPPNGQPDWGPVRRSSSFELLSNGEEPDLSWVQSLVKESPQDVTESKSSAAVGPSMPTDQIEQVDPSVLGAWLEQMQLDQLMAQ